MRLICLTYVLTVTEKILDKINKSNPTVIMAKEKTETNEIEICDFYSIYSRDVVREIDERILKAQNEYDARMRQAMATAKDFIISH